MKYPPPPSTIGKRGSLLDRSGKRRCFTVTNEIRRVVPPHVLDFAIYLQRIEFDDGPIQARLGYYIIAKKGSVRGKWVWGQYAPLLSMRDLKAVMKQAKKKGWI
jgi:hypothetical protein